ncbi:MAG: LptF/LptG family permease, partial [Gammaproteobacteria bacterium]
MLIRRYVAREVALTLGAVTGVLYLIYVSHRLVRFLAEAEQGQVPGAFLLQLLALKSLSNLPALLPLALFLAVLLAFGRLHRDGEAVAMAACGVGPGRLQQGVLLVALPAAALVAAVSLALGPWAERRAAALEARAAAQAELEAVAPGRFQSFHGGRVVFYARERDGAG